ncbi:hypothetical protein HP499_24085, partial [Paenarthrobacter sp. CM16]|uniref:hypothetical protein n=1 Tax=Paenarthrobacter sp. CM16 TaxID=2738447 RepID=UPI0015548B67
MVNFEAELTSPSALRKSYLLLSINELANDNRHRSADTALMYREAETFGVDRRSFGSDLEALLDKGWIFYEKTSGNPSDVTITQRGADFAEEFSTFINDPRRRATAVREALLQWLYEERLHGTTAPNISGFPNSKYGSFYGKKFTDHEIKQA